MYLRKIVILLVAGLSGNMVATANDSAAVVSRYLPSSSFFNSVYTQPAAMLWLPNTGNGLLEAGYAYNKQNSYHLLREGEGGSRFHLNAEGISRQSRMVFWGNASYAYANRNKVQWCDASDYFRLGPYLIADSTGGNMMGETYALSGGFSIATGRWSWAAEAGYRAGSDYRKKDPRPKTVVSDLLAKLSGSTALGRYQAGLTINGGMYKQSLNVSIMGNSNKTYLYAMRGFGLYDVQQSKQASSFDWLYQGNSYGTSIFLLPHNAQGWLMQLGVDKEHIESYSEQNMRPFEFKTLTPSANIGYIFKSKDVSTQIKTSWSYQKGTGTERIYEYIQIPGSSVSEYRMLNQSDKYKRNLNNVALSGLREWYGTNSHKWLQLNAGINSYSESYALPAYKAEYSHAQVQVLGGVEYFFKKSELTAELALGMSPLISKSEVLPVNNSIFNHSMQPDLNVMGTSPYSTGLKLAYEHALYSSMKWYFSVHAFDWFQNNQHAVTANIIVGIRL